MNRFFTNDIQNDQAILGEEDAYHLKNVLRARIGEEFEICDGDGVVASCSLSFGDLRAAL